MSSKEKGVVLGDVIKFETPLGYCRVQKNVSRNLTATVALVVGEMMEPDGDVAQVHTVTVTGIADGGTFKLGYKGQWSAAIAWNADLAACKAAFELIPLVLALDTVTFSAAGGANATTITWGTAGQKDEIEVDARLLTDGGVVLDGDYAVSVTTIGSTTAEMVILATGGSCSGILLEAVTLEDLQDDNDISRAFLVKGPAIVAQDNLFGVAAQVATAIAALEALGIDCRPSSTIYSSGVPTS